MLSELQLESLSGKHLIGNIKTAWDDRLYRATNVTRIKDEILRSHVTFFHDDDARTNDLKTFLTDVRFKYHDEFTEVTSCMRWIRGHGTDCLVVWYDNKSKSSELLLRMYQENRNFRRIPVIVLHASESDIDLFKNQCPDLFVDRFILFDRNRERFRTALIETFEGLGKEHSRRRLLEVGGLRGQRMLERAQVTKRVGHDVPQALVVGKAAVLIHERHAQAGHTRHVAAGRLQRAGNETHECGLAGAVAPHDGPAIAGGDGERDIAKNFRGAEIDSGIPKGYKRHARILIGKTLPPSP
jgi:hypothetical protein